MKLLKIAVIFLIGISIIASVVIDQMIRHSYLTYDESIEKGTWRRTEYPEVMAIISGVETLLKREAITQSELKNHINMAVKDLVRIEGGSFTMGVTSSNVGTYPDNWLTNDKKSLYLSFDIDDHPEHEVMLTSFYMSRYEVTNKQFFVNN